MILSIYSGENIALISGVKRARTYPENGACYVEISCYGEPIDEVWKLTGPSFILNDDGKVIEELPYGDCKKKEPCTIEPGLSVKIGGPIVPTTENMFTPDIKVEFMGNYVSPQDIGMRRKIEEAIYNEFEKKDGRGGERWCLKR